MYFLACRSSLMHTIAAFRFTSFRSVSNEALPEVLLNSPFTNEKFVSAFRPYYEIESPVKIVCGQTHFPASEIWNDIDYLRQKIGDVVCDVEIGSSEGDKASIPFEHYALYLRMWKDRYESNDTQDLPTDQLLYLAQNDLPSQLVGDIQIPSVCTDASWLGHGKLYSTMIWIGPTGCNSPLHFDPLDNFLMQIVGSKRVLLVNKETDNNSLYVGETFHQQSNMSAVNAENPDYEKHPKFKEVHRILSTELSPGDILFIPSRWWHAVRTLEYSISVNAWWR